VARRKALEGGVITSLVLCGVFTLLITAAIVFTLGREALRFFNFRDTPLVAIDGQPARGTVEQEAGNWVFRLVPEQRDRVRFVTTPGADLPDSVTAVAIDEQHRFFVRVPPPDGQFGDRQYSDFPIRSVQGDHLVLASGPPEPITTPRPMRIARDAVNDAEFFFGLHWSPLLGAQQHFGVWPLICGTLMVTVVAMLIAGPLGLITAIWLSEYAPMRLRNLLKPVLEILAGVPTVVLGFFALTVITPTLQFAFWPVPVIGGDGKPLMGSDGNPVMGAWNPFNIDVYNVLSAGIAVGILTLPIITSLTEDALRAVPRSLREASYGLGSTRFETSTQVVFPAALSGVIAAFLLAIARCVGETMIVALAAGGTHLPLHYITQPPMVLNVWHEAGAPDGSATHATLTATTPWTSPAISVSRGEKLDEVKTILRPGTTATALAFRVGDTGGATIAEGTLPIEPPAEGAFAWANWELPRRDLTGAERPAGEQAKTFGTRLDAGTYTISITPVGGEAQVGFVQIDGERYMPLADRLALPFDVRRSMQPMTGYLVQIFLGDTSSLGIEYYSSYAVAALLFAITFGLTIIGHLIRVRFRQQYE
jgi:phosphate ABC transporter permease protein PstC